jgi:hypothetical protein
MKTTEIYEARTAPSQDKVLNYLQKNFLCLSAELSQKELRKNYQFHSIEGHCNILVDYNSSNVSSRKPQIRRAVIQIQNPGPSPIHFDELTDLLESNGFEKKS